MYIYIYIVYIYIYYRSDSRGWRASSPASPTASPTIRRYDVVDVRQYDTVDGVSVDG